MTGLPGFADILAGLMTSTDASRKHPNPVLPDHILTSRLDLRVYRPEDAADVTALFTRDLDALMEWSPVLFEDPTSEQQVLEHHIQPRIDARSKEGFAHMTAYAVRDRRSKELLGEVLVSNRGDSMHEVGFLFGTRISQRDKVQAVGAVVHTLRRDSGVKGIYAREDAADTNAVAVWSDLGFDEVLRAPDSDSMFAWDGLELRSGTGVMMALSPAAVLDPDVRPITPGSGRPNGPTALTDGRPGRR